MIFSWYLLIVCWLFSFIVFVDCCLLFFLYVFVDGFCLSLLFFFYCRCWLFLVIVIDCFWIVFDDCFLLIVINCFFHCFCWLVCWLLLRSPSGVAPPPTVFEACVLRSVFLREKKQQIGKQATENIIQKIQQTTSNADFRFISDAF